MAFFWNWHIDPILTSLAVTPAAAYFAAARAFARRRARPWPAARTICFSSGIFSGVAVVASPLDTFGEASFAPHMVQHLFLADVTAPLMLLGAPLLLALSTSPPHIARRITAAARSPVARVVAFPVTTWSFFVVTQWGIHFTALFESALQNEGIHQVEHALLFTSAVMFWLPIIAIGPTPWLGGALGFPLRMLYLIAAMPALALLGFLIYGAKHVLYASYAAAGLVDQQYAGEIMWIGGSFAMFVAFMLVGWRWAVAEEGLGERLNARLLQR